MFFFPLITVATRKLKWLGEKSKTINNNKFHSISFPVYSADKNFLSTEKSDRRYTMIVLMSLDVDVGSTAD